MPSDTPKAFYLTTPIYYINALPHIGTAYTTIVADTVARFQRFLGREVLFATGTDEHAEKVVQAAKARDMTAEAYSADMADKFREAWCRLDITFDDFIRTPEPRHHRAVQELVRRLLESGDIYAGDYEGWYCVPCATFLLENDLEEGNCPDCGREVERRSQPAYFFAASKYREPLLRHIEEHPDFIVPDFRRNETVSFIREMRDACVSRPNDGWGIPFPDDPAHVVYVWFDALINYITVAGWPDDMERFDRVWPADLHLMAKDILPRFHGSMWPAMLMALGLPLPKKVAAHGYWQMGGAKISKSRGNVIDPFELASDLEKETGIDFNVALDAIRYFVLRETAFGQDAGFTDEAFRGRLNADLANDLGNSLNRCLPLIERNCEGRVPEGTLDPDLAQATQACARTAREALESLDFRGALEAVWAVIAQINKYVGTQEPWALARDPGSAQRLSDVLYSAAESIRCVTAMLYPVLPHAVAAMRIQLGLPPAPEGTWDAAVAPGAEGLAGRAIARGNPVFPRVEQKPAEPSAPEPEPAKEATPVDTVTYEDFMRIQLRVATVEAGERVEGADKLYKLDLAVGDEKRTIVAGLAQDFGLDELVGKQIIIVANLEPRKVRGVLSQGMLLAVTDPVTDRPAAIVTVDRPAPSGARLR